MTNPITFLGLDVHKETIAVAIAEGQSGDVRFYGDIANTADAVAGMLKKLGNRYGKLHVVYEAGNLRVRPLSSDQRSWPCV